jgi:hypothetical protein
MMVEIGPTSLGLKESPEMATGVRYWCWPAITLCFFTNLLELALTDVGRPPPLGRVELDSDKENAGSPVNKKRRILAITGSPAVSSSTRKDIKG